MEAKGILYLAVTLGLFLVFAGLVAYTCSRKRRDRLEAPKHRMLDED
ncbi:MAG: cbb3-type cytochrome c oxidase subunit 3 [Desulfuromonadales bacterium]|nr:cbb3-type cytochrome c oxidase subunit 3 [Desulfuromonadales bacterium]